ncbi:hypothetical protein K9B35_15575 [Sphingomonas sp. R647]|uniref:hypothetical protein n=1 Tax=Sphingomonas sp. R647 TaxID=2875233 RepID=UPI001CD38608|nr:hypothetical protein [Sphingomonas sp. R647]MCA1199389.1 hypothetical protein [Sphingomonas sp. R647]
MQPIMPPPPKWAVLSWAAVLLMLIGGGVWLKLSGAQTDIERSVLVIDARVQATAPALRRCFDKPNAHGLVLQGGPTWLSVEGQHPIWEARNDARKLRIQIEERGLERLVRVYTRDGRPLRASERRIIDACIALPPV